MNESESSSDMTVDGSPSSSSTAAEPPTTCTSCGDEDFLVAVHRVYITPDDWDSEPSRRTSAETEYWCGVCLVHYPHERIEA